jgi:predicted ester cyclase
MRNKNRLGVAGALVAALVAALAVSASSSGPSATSQIKAASSAATSCRSTTAVSEGSGATDVVWSPQTKAATALGQANMARFETIVNQGINAGHLQVMDQFISPTVVDHEAYGPGYPPSRAGIKALTAALRTAFPDVHSVATTLVASNDGTMTFAVIRTVGTNTGPYLGIKPSGRKVDFNIVEAFRWQNGQVVEHWGVADNIALLTQMGFFPANAFPVFSTADLAPQYQQQLAHPRTLHPFTATTVDQRIAAVCRGINLGVNGGDLWATAEIAAPNYAESESYGSGYPGGIADTRDAIAVNRTALPDLHTSTPYLGVIGDGSQVFGILEAQGTNSGPFLGSKPTGKKVDIDVMEYWHFDSNGQIDAHNGIADLFGLISQLGFVPPSAVPAYTQSKVDPQFWPELNLH